MTRSWWTVASVAATTANFYLTTWEEFHTGTLYLGVFSGPVEGIIIIVVIYIITAIYGACFTRIYHTHSYSTCRASVGSGVWSLPLLSLPVLSTITSIDPIAKIIPLSVHYLPINIAFMIFSAFGLAFNIFVSYVLSTPGSSCTVSLLSTNLGTATCSGH
jgi:ethanolaminephosphotransferase